MNLRLDFVPLRSAGYRRYILGWSIMLTSGWIFYTAQTWTFLQSSGTAAAVAFLPIALVLPVPVALVIGGLLTDRRGPRSVLVVAQVSTGLTVAAIGGLAATGNLTLWPTLIAGAVLGTCGGLGSVPGQAIMVRLVDRSQLASAYGLSLITFGIGRLIGGPIGGVIVQSMGPVPAFVVSAAGFLVAAALFRTLPRLEGLQAATAGLSRRDFADVLGWARHAPAILALLAMEAIVAVLISPYTAVMPVIARDILGGRSGELGILVAAGGAGIVTGGLLMAPLSRRIGQGRFLVGSIALSIVGVAGLSLSTSLALSCLLAALAGGADNASALTRALLLQTYSPARLRGRVLALDGVVSALANPASLLAVGLLVATYGASPILLGLAVLAGLALFLLTFAHRPVLRLHADGPDDLSRADAAA